MVPGPGNRWGRSPLGCFQSRAEVRPCRMLQQRADRWPACFWGHSLVTASSSQDLQGKLESAKRRGGNSFPRRKNSTHEEAQGQGRAGALGERRTRQMRLEQARLCWPCDHVGEAGLHLEGVGTQGSLLSWR